MMSLLLLSVSLFQTDKLAFPKVSFPNGPIYVKFVSRPAGDIAAMPRRRIRSTIFKITRDKRKGALGLTIEPYKVWVPPESSYSAELLSDRPIDVLERENPFFKIKCGERLGSKSGVWAKPDGSRPIATYVTALNPYNPLNPGELVYPTKPVAVGESWQYEPYRPFLQALYFDPGAAKATATLVSVDSSTLRVHFSCKRLEDQTVRDEHQTAPVRITARWIEEGEYVIDRASGLPLRGWVTFLWGQVIYSNVGTPKERRIGPGDHVNRIEFAQVPRHTRLD